MRLDFNNSREPRGYGHGDGLSVQGPSETRDTRAEPLPDSRHRDPFPVTIFPDPLRSYVISHADALGVSPECVAVPLLSALAGTIGNARAVELKRTWVEPVVVWAAIVGASGTLKSPARDAAIAPIRRIETLERVQHRGAMAQYERDLADWEAAGRQPEEEPPPPMASRLTVSDTTTEALAVILEENPRGILLERDELGGWLGSFDGYKSARGADEAFWLEAHRAGSHTVDRKGSRSPLHIPRLAVSVTGTIQPQVLARMLGHARYESGLAARMLLVMPPTPRKRWTEYEGDASIDAETDELFLRLRALKPITDKSGVLTPIVLPLTPAGRDAWGAFYDSWNAVAEADEADAAAASKLEGYAARFALLFAVACDPDTKSVDARDVEAGSELAWWFRKETRRVYDELGATSNARNRANLLQWIHNRGGQTSVRELQHSGPRHFRSSSSRARAALDELYNEGLGLWCHMETGGRPVEVLRLTSDEPKEISP